MRIAIASFLLFASLAGCRAPSPAPVSSVTAPTPAPSVPASATPQPHAEPPASGDEDCVRGEPKPFLDASRVKDHRFVPGVGARAEESATLADGTAIRIGHMGCAHYVEVFRFVLPREKDGNWAARASALLKSLPTDERRAKDVEFWTEKLDAHATANPKPGAPVEVDLVEGFSWIRVEAKPASGGTELEIVYDVAL